MGKADAKSQPKSTMENKENDQDTGSKTQQSGEPPAKKSRQSGTVTGLLRAASRSVGATKVAAMGSRKSVLGVLPQDFGAMEEYDDSWPVYDDEQDDEPEAPRAFEYQDYDDLGPGFDDDDGGFGDGDEDDWNLGDNTTDTDEFHPDDLFADFMAGESEGEGPPIVGDIADLVNKIWISLQKDLSKVYEGYPRPTNLHTYKVDVNDEVVPLIQKKREVKQTDMKLRSVQGAVAGVANITVKNLESLRNLENANEADTVKYLTRVVKASVHGVKLLAHANMTVNNTRRQLLKQAINPKYHLLCKPSKTLDSKLLFGDSISDRLKTLTQASKLGKPSGYSYGYGRGSGFRGRSWNNNYRGGRSSFLGKFVDHTAHDSYLQGARVETQIEQTDTELFSDVFYRPRPRKQGSRPEARPEAVERPSSTATVATQVVGELPEIDLNYWPNYTAGRASQCLFEWQKITADRVILNHVKGLTIDFSEMPNQTWIPKPIHFSQKEKQYLGTEIAQLLQMQVIEQTEHCEGEFISVIFLRPKKQPGKYRVILNLKGLNLDVEYHHFKMDTLETALKLVTRGCFMISIDIKDAYYTIRIHEDYRKYLRFEFEGQLYQFTCLPNGLALGPRIFTKILKVPLAHLRQTYGVNTSAYIDDLLLTEISIKSCHMAAFRTVQILQKLGFTISPKSVLQPRQVIEHVGFVIDSVHMKVSLPTDKVTNLKDYIRKCLRKEVFTIREVAQLLGKLEATKPGNRLAQLYTKTLTWEKNAALARNCYDFEKKMTLSGKVKGDLHWWLDNLATVNADIFVEQPDDMIYTDASNDGWGCHAPSFDQKFGGRWNEFEQDYHINVLELLAVLYSLQAVCHELHDIHLRVMTDNTTAMLCIRNQGSVHSKDCNDVTRRIWEWACERNIWLSAAHIPGVLNVEADTASRKFSDDTEWALNDDIFRNICQQFGTPDVDLFASRLNRKVERFCSWQPDPEAEHIDAFTISWAGILGYAFPPFAVLPSVIQKIKMEGAEVIVVAPKWPTKPWYTLMQKMIVSDVLEIPVINGTLFLPSRVKMNTDTRGHHRTHKGQEHPLVGQLHLIVAKLSGEHYS